MVDCSSLFAQVQHPAHIAVDKFKNGPGNDFVEEDKGFQAKAAAIRQGGDVLPGCFGRSIPEGLFLGMDGFFFPGAAQKAGGEMDDGRAFQSGGQLFLGIVFFQKINLPDGLGGEGIEIGRYVKTHGHNFAPFFADRIDGALIVMGHIAAEFFNELHAGQTKEEPFED